MALLPCPICGRRFDSTVSPAMPFCSLRCKEVDLGRWLEEKYSLPHEPGEDELDEPPGTGWEPGKSP